MHEIRVVVVDCGRKYLQMRYTDAEGTVHQRSTKETQRRKAERKAADWERELKQNLHAADGRMPWHEFRQKYEEEACSGLAEGTREKIFYVLNGLEEAHGLKRLADVGPALIRTWAHDLRKAGRSESTINSYLAHLRAALQWAVDCEYLPAVPKFPKVQRAKIGAKAKVMKGRPITEKEFSQILSVVPQVLESRPTLAAGPHPVDQWRFYLSGLWWSGLRLEESLILSWEPGEFWADFSGRFPMFRIDAEAEKGNRDRILPMAPEFANFLSAVPEADRKGPVFRLPKRRQGAILRGEWVSKNLTAFGRAAAVVVDAKTGKCASAHDFRRSFGERWAKKVMPQVLMELMRHENIETTMRFYVGRNAEATAREIWGLDNGKGTDAGSGKD